MFGCSITGHHAEYKSAGIYSTGSLYAANTIISGNITSMGGGIYCASGEATITYMTIAGNKAKAGGVYVDDTAVVTVMNSIVSVNYHQSSSVSQSPGRTVGGSSQRPDRRQSPFCRYAQLLCRGIRGTLFKGTRRLPATEDSPGVDAGDNSLLVAPDGFSLDQAIIS